MCRPVRALVSRSALPTSRRGRLKSPAPLPGLVKEPGRCGDAGQGVPNRLDLAHAVCCNPLRAHGAQGWLGGRDQGRLLRRIDLPADRHHGVLCRDEAEVGGGIRCDEVALQGTQRRHCGSAVRISLHPGPGCDPWMSEWYDGRLGWAPCVTSDPGRSEGLARTASVW